MDKNSSSVHRLPPSLPLHSLNAVLFCFEFTIDYFFNQNFSSADSLMWMPAKINLIYYVLVLK